MYSDWWYSTPDGAYSYSRYKLYVIPSCIITGESAIMVAIRALQASDGERGLWRVYAGLSSAPPLDSESMKKLVAELDADVNRFIVVAIDGDDDNVVGTASLVLERKLIRGGALCAHIEDVVVDTETRGKGVGKRLIAHLVDMARHRDCYKVILDCAEDNVPFYERCGFKRKEVQMAFYF